MFMKQVPQGHCMIVERFRKPVKVCNSGLHFFIPFLDQVREVSRFCGWGSETNQDGIFIELTEQITQAKRAKLLNAQGLVMKEHGKVKKDAVAKRAGAAGNDETSFEQFYTLDNVKVTIDCIFRWRVADPITAVYEVDHLHEMLTKVVLSEIRAYVGSHNLAHLLSARDQFSEFIVANVSDTVKKWGIVLTGVDIRKLELDEETQAANRRQLEASRESEAKKLAAIGQSEAVKQKAEGEAVALERQAEADKKAAIMRAEGAAESVKLRAEGERAYVEMLVKTLGKEAATKVLVAKKTFDAFGAITSGEESKVYLSTPEMPSVEAVKA